jgi:guanylate kinase
MPVVCASKQQVRKSALGPHCLFIFVAPPSHEELERRLRHRGTETEDKVLQRLANAESEIAKAQVRLEAASVGTATVGRRGGQNRPWHTARV